MARILFNGFNDMDMIYIIAISLVLIALEIWFDKTRWKQKKSDKPLSTILWLVIVMAVSLIVPGAYYMNVALFVSMRFAFFDFALNISRWNELPTTFNHNYKKLKFKTFIGRLFYHGRFKKKFSYDWIFQRIPPQMELLLKGIVLYLAIYLR